MSTNDVMTAPTPEDLQNANVAAGATQTAEAPKEATPAPEAAPAVAKAQSSTVMDATPTNNDLSGAPVVDLGKFIKADGQIDKDAFRKWLQSGKTLTIKTKNGAILDFTPLKEGSKRSNEERAARPNRPKSVAEGNKTSYDNVQAASQEADVRNVLDTMGYNDLASTLVEVSNESGYDVLVKGDINSKAIDFLHVTPQKQQQTLQKSAKNITQAKKKKETEVAQAAAETKPAAPAEEKSWWDKWKWLVYTALAAVAGTAAFLVIRNLIRKKGTEVAKSPLSPDPVNPNKPIIDHVDTVPGDSYSDIISNGPNPDRFNNLGIGSNNSNTGSNNSGLGTNITTPGDSYSDIISNSRPTSTRV